MADDENFLVHMKLSPESQSYFHYRLEAAPDSVIGPSGKEIRPEVLIVAMALDDQARWEVALIQLNGDLIKNGEVHKRDYFASVYFSEPLAEDSSYELPAWLRVIGEHHVLLMNDGSKELRERQEKAAREAARKMFSFASQDMADEMADNILNAMRRVG